MFLGICIPNYYHSAVSRLRGLCLVTGAYVRPTAKTSNQEAISGSKLVKPPHLRPVPESEDMVAHVRAAASLHMIQPEFDVRPDPDIVSAIMRCVALRKGSELAQWREDQIRAVREISDTLAPFGDFISSLMSGPSASIASHVNLAMMSCEGPRTASGEVPSCAPRVPLRHTKTRIHVAVVIETLIRGGESHFSQQGLSDGVVAII